MYRLFPYQELLHLLHADGITAADVTIAHVGADLILTLIDGETLTLKDFDTYPVETLEFADGSTQGISSYQPQDWTGRRKTWFSSGRDNYFGGEGDDTLNGHTAKILLQFQTSRFRFLCCLCATQQRVSARTIVALQNQCHVQTPSERQTGKAFHDEIPPLPVAALACAGFFTFLGKNIMPPPNKTNRTPIPMAMRDPALSRPG